MPLVKSIKLPFTVISNPQNIVINSDLSVKLVDFGLAKGLSQTGEVVSGFIGGTPHFMAPGVNASNSLLSCATDVYAVLLRFGCFR